MYKKATTIPKEKTFFQPAKNQINQQNASKSTEQLQKMQPLLNSERIKFLFDTYEVKLISQDNHIRVSNLNANEIMQTCAIVKFANTLPAWLKATHNKIYQGGSIGQTIKDNGFSLIKENLYFGIIELSARLKLEMRTEEKSAAVHIYELVVKNPETLETFIYCTITEIHNPFYLTLGDLKQLYPQETLKYDGLTESLQKELTELSDLDDLFKPKVMSA